MKYDRVDDQKKNAPIKMIGIWHENDMNEQ